MVDFTRVLSNVPQINPTSGSVGRVNTTDSSKEALVTGILGAAGMGLELFKDYKEKSVLAEYFEASKGLLDPNQEAEMAVEAGPEPEKVAEAVAVSSPVAGPGEEIFAQPSTDPERQALVAAGRAVSRLDAGEQQGKLTANAIERRRVALYKEFASKYPQLEPQLAQVFSRQRAVSSILDQDLRNEERAVAEKNALVTNKMVTSLVNAGYGALAQQVQGDPTALAQAYEETVGKQERLIAQTEQQMKLIKNKRELSEFQKKDEMEKLMYQWANQSVYDMGGLTSQLTSLPQDQREKALLDFETKSIASIGKMFQDAGIPFTEETIKQYAPVYTTILANTKAALKSSSPEEALKAIQTQNNLMIETARSGIYNNNPEALRALVVAKDFGNVLTDIESFQNMTGVVDGLIGDRKLNPEAAKEAGLNRYGELDSSQKLTDNLVVQPDSNPSKAAAMISTEVRSKFLAKFRTSEPDERQAKELATTFNMILNSDAADEKAGVVRQFMPALANASSMAVFTKTGPVGEKLRDKFTPRVDRFVEDVGLAGDRLSRETGVKPEFSLNKETGEILIQVPSGTRQDVADRFRKVQEQLNYGIRAKAHINGDSKYAEAIRGYVPVFQKYF